MSGSGRMDFPDTATAEEHVCVFDMDADACLICGRTAEEAAKLEEAQERRELAAVGGILAKVSPTAWKYSQELKAQVPKPIQSRVEWQRSPETCRMACLCMSCLGCMAVSIVLYGLWGLIYDENECSSGSHNCSTFARCEDRSGTYQCFCHDGYYGDGWDCRDIDECLDPDRLGCDPNAECENSAGSFACECDEGYLGTGDATGLGGSGVECTDIDECLDDNGGCGPALYNLCLNEPSTWTCTDVLECQADNGGCGELELAACAELRGAAPICSDIDECATDNGGCDDGFICINHDGLQGEPNECIDRDECVGSVSVGWSVVVPLELVTVPLKTAASIAIQDPTAVGEANAATIITVGERWAQGVPASPVQSYVWVKEPAGCPSGCGNAAVTLADGYICRRDGLQVPHRFCIANLGPPPVSSVACPPTNDCHCEGSWSACTSSCRDSVFTVSRPRSGTVGNGRDCEATDAETRPCLSGQGACNPYADPSADMDCIGDYPPCAADCGRSFYNITRMNNGTGRACSAPGTSHECTPGMGFCAPDVDCIGAWTACDGSCVRTFEIAIEQSGTGQPCEAAHDDFEMCSAGDSCDDGESLTMGDACGEEMGCSGAVTLAAALTYDIKVDPARLSVEERTALEDGLREGIASVLSAAGLAAETAAVRVVGIEAVGTHECDPSATCTNEIGSYRCACNDGFAGDGFVCADIDECDVDRGGCDPRHAIAYREAESSSFSHVASVFNNSIIGYCENTPGSFHCGCVAGFELNATDEQTCHDIDECVVYPNGNCGPSLYFNCTNNLGMNATCGGGYPACPAEGEFRDCDGACFSASLSPEKLLLLGTPVPSAWLGDGWCDNGAQGVDFNCSEWHFDNGDCG